MKIKSGFVLQQVGTGYLAVAVGDRSNEFSGLVRMNGTGAFLWNLLCEGDMTHEQLVEKMLSEYDATREQVEGDITAFENKLRENGILD
jgi:hypothetical protein